MYPSTFPALPMFDPTAQNTNNVYEIAGKQANQANAYKSAFRNISTIT